jgi:3-deoxy-D-manno-octulosonate 8-phosphate phosphatase (KDO 8-P phosphatase)
MSIELIVLDVDGTMTNGEITYSSSGEELKSFDVKDGLAIASWIKLGKHVAIITGRKSTIVERRAKELQIDFLYQGIKNKAAILDEITQKLNISMNRVAAIGDDLNDLSMLKRVGMSFAPANASSYITPMVDIVVKHNGGEGAVREMIEYIIKNDNLEEEFLSIWQSE